VHIDWLNVWQQFEPADYPDYIGGRFFSVEGCAHLQSSTAVDPFSGERIEGWLLAGAEEIEYQTARFAQHRGSYETSIFVRMVNGRLEVRGNPSSYGRLDNVFGVSLDEGIAVYNSILRGLGLPEFTEGEVERHWLQGEEKFVERYTGAHVTRVDVTQNYAVGMGNVRRYHQWLAKQKIYRSAPGDSDLEKFAAWDYETVVPSTSKYWVNTKFYDKGAQIEDVLLPEYGRKLRRAAADGRIAKSDVRPLLMEAEAYLLNLAEWCATEGITRGEWSYRSRYFAQHQGLGYWQPGETESALYERVAEEMEKIAKRAVVHQADAYSSLSASEYRWLDQWKKGVNVKGEVPERTFYRVRSAILKKTGHDIAARPVEAQREADFRPVFFRVRPVRSSDAPKFYEFPQAA